MGAKQQTEKRFMQVVIDFARLHRWEVFHVFDSRRSAAGFPDCVFVRNGRLVFAELKLSGRKPEAAQVLWLGLLGAVAMKSAGAVEVFLWTPADWKSIELVLGGGA